MIYVVFCTDRSTVNGGFVTYNHYVEAEDDLTALQMAAAVIDPDHMVIDVREV